MDRFAFVVVEIGAYILLGSDTEVGQLGLISVAWILQKEFNFGIDHGVSIR